MGIDPATLAREQRLRKLRAALANAERGLSLAASAAFKALLLAAMNDERSGRKAATEVIGGEFGRRDNQ